MYYVYVHTCPNGKIYVGCSCIPLERWNNGVGYNDHKEFYEDINIYGWENIKHEIIDSAETQEDAERLEQLYIILLDAENPEIGYNKTKYKKKALETYFAKQPLKKYTGNKYERNESEEKNIFEKYCRPRSACAALIDEWIFDERARAVLKRRYLDGYSINKIAKEFNVSATYVKKVNRECIPIIESHI